MRKFLVGATAVVLLCVGTIWAFSQTGNGVVSFFVGSTVTPVSASNPLPVTGGGGGSSSVIIAPSSAASSGIAPVVAGAAVSSSVLKATPGNLYSLYAVCTAQCWLMVFNATSAPANGATTSGIAATNLQDCTPIPAGGSASINYAPGPPEVFSTGITAAISSTACATLTLSTVGFIHGSIQ